MDLSAGHQFVEPADETFDVQGVLLPRPFKVVAIGPISLFVERIEEAERFYTDVLGLEVTARTTWQGEACVFLRAGTEHHSVALYPLSLREPMGMSPHSSLGPIGLRVANYRQLRDALSFLGGGAPPVVLSPALHPGIEYAACVRDPDGHTVQLYFHMDQVASPARAPDEEGPGPVASWPESVPAAAGPAGESYLGPWG